MSIQIMDTIICQTIHRSRPLASIIRTMAISSLKGSASSPILLSTVGRNSPAKFPTEPIQKSTKNPIQPQVKQSRYIQPSPISSCLPFTRPKLTPRGMITTSKPAPPYSRCYCNNVGVAICRNPDNLGVLTTILVTNGTTYTQGPPICLYQDLIESSSANNECGPKESQQPSKDEAASVEEVEFAKVESDIVFDEAFFVFCVHILGACCNVWLVCMIAEEEYDAEQLERHLLETMISRS